MHIWLDINLKMRHANKVESPFFFHRILLSTYAKWIQLLGVIKFIFLIMIRKNEEVRMRMKKYGPIRERTRVLLNRHIFSVS